MKETTELAYGKINLSLDVIGRRADGYHLVCMIMQTVGIADTIEIREMDKEEISVETDSGHIPDGPDNLVWKAADIMRREYGLKSGLSIHLTKRIPIAAGMAGGSADAAAVMRALRRMYALDAPDHRLEELALPIGADVPYCIAGGTQLSEGIGEVLTVLPHAPQCSLVVVKPDLYVSTGWVYKAFDGIPGEEIRHPDVDAMAACIDRGDLRGMASLCGNVLEQKTGQEYPVIGELERFLSESGAVRALMTGSGPTVFGIFEDKEKAQRALDGLNDRYPDFQRFLTEFVWPEEL